MSLPIIQTIQNNINSLNSSKLDIKNAVNTDYDFITNEQIESYPSLIKQGIAHYKNRVPHATKEGTDLSFDAVPLKFDNMTIKGNTSQASTTGVQLLDMSDAVNGYFTGDDGATNTANAGFHTQEYTDVSGKTTMYARFEALNNIKIGRFWMQEYDENYTSLKRTLVGIYDTTFTKGQVRKYSQNFQANTKYVRFSAYTLSALENDSYVDKHPIKDNWNTYVRAMLSLTEMDTFEPYTGGQPSPSPDYPQDIHIVTGNNTIHVNNTDYPLNLGSLELCKIGDYQDYIYKENGNWYIQKNTKKTILDKPTTGNLNTDYTYNYFSYNGEPSEIYQGTNIICSHFIGAYNVPDMRTKAQYNNSIFWESNTTFVRVDKFNTVEEYINALSADDITIIGISKTPTTTQITDQTLIAQLNAIDKAKGVDGTTIITIDSDDLKPILNFTAYLKEVE